MAIEFGLAKIFGASKKPVALVLLFSILSYAVLSHYMTENVQIFLNSVVFIVNWQDTPHFVRG